jgi:DHA2 family multidrug resistance protein-like MFS transporter
MARSVRQRPWLVLAVLCIAVLIVVIDNTIVNVALPTLSAKLGASDSGLQWIVDSYSLPFAGLLLAGGELSDRWGRRRVMQSSLLLFAVFSMVAAESHSMTQLLIARALMGASAAFIFPATLSLVTTAFDDLAQRAKAFGIWGATAGIAVAIGPIAGGYLVDHFWFGSVFVVNVPFACVTIVLVAFLVPESRSPVLRRVDLGGLVMGSVSISSLVLAIIEGPSWGWLSARVLGLFVASFILLVVFGLYERRLDDPMLDIRLFRRGEFSAAAAAIATSFFCLFGFVFLVTQYFQLVHGYSPLSAGVHTLPFAVVTMIATPLGAVAALRIGIRWVVSVGLAVMGGSMMWMTQFGAHAAYWGPVVISMMILALGFSLISSPSTSALMSSLSPAQIGAGAAVNETTRELGGTLGVAVVGSVFASLFGRRIAQVLTPLQLSHHDIVVAQSSMQAALRVVGGVAPTGRSAEAATVHAGVTQAFMDGFHHGCVVAAVTAIVVAVVTFFYLPRQTATPGHAEHTVDTAEPK